MLMKGQFSMGALKPHYHKNPVGQSVTDEGNYQVLQEK